MRIFSILNENLEINAPPQGLANTTGVDVVNLQSALEALGYSVGSTGIDGIYGRRTARAVRKYQQDKELTVDGDAGPSTVSAILQDIKQQGIDVEPGTEQDVKVAPMSSPTVVQSNREGGIDGKVLDLIAAPESSGRYDAVYPSSRNPDILEMPLEDLLQDMRRRGQTVGSSATGRYQYTYDTLKRIIQEMGLDPSTRFDPQTQDKIALYHLKQDHGLDQWKAGRMSDRQFLEMLSRTWAGLPDPKTGKSYYKGILNNKANISAKSALNTLQSIRRSA